MKKLLMAAVIPVLAFGCGDEMVDANGDGIADGIQTPDNVTVVVPAEPKGTVSGQVLSTQQKPLAGVTVTMTIGSDIGTNTATTDAGGNFAFKEIPGGAQVLLTFSMNGYASLRAVSVVPNNAGTVPINDGNASFGPVVLSESNGSVRFTAIAPTGRPAEGVKATLEVLGAGTVLFGPTDQVSSTVVAEATADANGVLTFNNVPPPAEIDRLRGTYRLIIYAYDSNGDGILESNGRVVEYSGESILTGANAKPLDLAYTYTTGQIRVTFSNLSAIRNSNIKAPQFNMIKTGDSIYIGFDQPVQPNSVVVGFTNEYGDSNLSITKGFSSGNTVLTLTPQGVQPGKEYNLFVRAIPVTGNSTYASTVAFFGGDQASPPAISVDSVRFQESSTNNGLIEYGEFVYVNFNQVMFPRLVTQAAYVYVHADLNNSGKLGDAVGERDPLTGRTLSTNSGFPLIPDEPSAPIQTKTPAEKPVFPLPNPGSGYTTRYRFQFTPGVLPSGAYPTLNPTSNFPVFINFSNLTPTVDAYESGWGVPQTADIIINGSSITPIPVPVAVP